MSANLLPTIDLSLVEGNNPSKFYDRLRHIAHEFGFFYVTGHGIPSELVSDMNQVARRFFGLPQSQKDALSMIHSPHFRGYNRTGQEYTRGERDWREQIDIGLERDALHDLSGKPAWYRLQGPNQWPTTVPSFRPVIQAWQKAAQSVLHIILQALAQSLGQKNDVFKRLMDRNAYQLLKLIHYPSQPGQKTGQGVGPHKDSDLLTLIAQDHAGGLEAQLSSGEWVAVPPKDGTLIVNIGELFEIASDGYFHAAVHRVISPSTERSRLSAAFFLGARLDATMPKLHLPAELAATPHQVTQDPNNPLLSHIGSNILKGRLRSHPDVARQHHSDLL